MMKLPSRLEPVRLAFGRLNQQEQFMVLAGMGALVLVVLLGTGLGVSSAISRAERRVEVRTKQLGEVLQLQDQYRTRVAKKEARMRELGRSKVRLVSLVEDVARQAGVEIGQLRPEQGEATEDGIVESRVDLRVTNVSADRMQDFLDRLEKAPGIVIVQRLKVLKPYRRDTLNLEVTVVTYQQKGPKS